MSNFWSNVTGLGLILGGAIAGSINSAVAEITQDSTLPINSQVTRQGKTITIGGGTRSGNNLFHSFEQFSLSTDSTAYFNNPIDIQNIISRVTGNSISNIDGILKANGTANLFLINPNGIVFGSQASLNINGSFLASTASSINFADGTKFSVTSPQTTPLLTVSIPTGLQFGAIAAPILNQSQAKPGGAVNIFRQPVGLKVQPGKTLALVGGDITLEGGNLTAASGRIELGSVAKNSLVSLSPTNQGWILGYEGVKEFQNIRLISRTVGNTAFTSHIDASGEGGGSIQIQGKNVELIGNLVRLITRTTGAIDGQDLTITANKLTVRDGAQVLTSTFGNGAGGDLILNVSDSVEVIGGFFDPNTNRSFSSALVSATAGGGKAGDMVINTSKFRIQNGAEVSTESSVRSINSQLIPAKGAGGNLTVNASESVEIFGRSSRGFASGLFATTFGTGEAGKVTITTGQLIVRDGSTIAVSSKLPPMSANVVYVGDVDNLGAAGELNISARSVLLDTQGRLLSEARSGRGGNITLQLRDSLLMRRESQISTNAGTADTGGDGGNITIDVPRGFIIAAPLENSDITANAFSGSGGRITIKANSIFGFVQRDRKDLVRLLQTEDPTKLNPRNLQTSDITAFSQQNPSLSGNVQINTPDADPSKGLVELPSNLVDASQQIVSSCNSSNQKVSSLTAIGQGGITRSPTEPLMGDAVLADWIGLEPDSNNRANSIHYREVSQQQTAQVNLGVGDNLPSEIIEAQGWVIDANGNVVLVAQSPTTIVHSLPLNPASCIAH